MGKTSENANKPNPTHRKIRWMRLDNAALIYPAVRNEKWSNVFRLSATLTEEVDVAVLQSALDVTVRRFPSIAARLRRGLFWYYLQPVEMAPRVRQENSYPLATMSREDIRRCGVRVIAWKNRIAVEIFHALADGNSGLIFLKSLVAEYLQQKHGIQIPAEEGVLDRREEPKAAELEDSFQKYAGPVSASRAATDAWHLTGTPEKDGFMNLTCFRMPVQQVLEKAHGCKVSLTAFLCAAMIMALQNMQEEQITNVRRRKALKVLIPVNLRRIFPSATLRNFILYTRPEIDPRLGRYSFEEICRIVHHRMGMEITPKHMASLIATNVSTERILAVKLMPLFIKNFIMRLVYINVGERKSCLSMSNLGAVKLPEEMKHYVQRMDFILGVQATTPCNCGVLSYGDSLYVNFIRGIREADLEYHFHKVLQEMGICAEVQSNQIVEE